MRICVVGSGTRFFSGISVYTIRLSNALSKRHQVSLVTMRRLLPERFYPGRRRVGHDLTELRIETSIERFDGIDWSWLPSLPRAMHFLAQRRPQVIVLQWWTGAVLHSYLALALGARLARVPLVIEFHEVLDTGEARLAPIRAYVRLIAPMILRMSSAFVVHSLYDHSLVTTTYNLGRSRPIAVIAHGPYDHHDSTGEKATPIRFAPPDTVNILFFGIIRPYKGLEFLVRAFDSIEPDEIHRYWLTVVGETWEGWTLPAELISASRYRDRITFINQYVPDDELSGHLLGADAVALPYLRSSVSGPLHVALCYGLPIIMSNVGGNAEAAAGYGGINLVPPANETALRVAIEALVDGDGERFAQPHSWDHTAGAYDDLFKRIGLQVDGLPTTDDAPSGEHRQ